MCTNRDLHREACSFNREMYTFSSSGLVFPFWKKLLMCNTVIGVILDFHNNESNYLLSYQKKNNSLFPSLESVPEESILTSLDVDVSES